MKNFLKRTLSKLHLLDWARMVYSLTAGFSFRKIAREIQFRLHGLPDHHPAPPPKLIFLVIRSVWAVDYWDSGLTITTDLRSLLTRHNVRTESLTRILDFGCGSGRLTRQFTDLEKAQVFGTDYNRTLIDWSAAALPRIKFSHNELRPPLEYESEFFDLIVARSVLTHLDSDLQREWIQEFRRILKPGGFLYFTVHGLISAQKLDRSIAKELNEQGFLALNRPLQGDNKCSAYETEEWVRENLAKGFTFVDHLPSRKEKHLEQEIYLFRRPV
jgi:SAM-dependent methyltransferase